MELTDLTKRRDESLPTTSSTIMKDSGTVCDDADFDFYLLNQSNNGSNNKQDKETAITEESSSTIPIACSGPNNTTGSIPVKENDNLVFLDRNLNLIHCISFILGSIIGTDIFFTPQGVLVNSGSTGVSLLIYLLCGFVCFLAAACYAELATMFRKSGGEFTYLYAAFGDRPAFVQVWIALVIGRTGGMAMMSVAFASISGNILYTGCDTPPDYLINLFAAITLSLLVIINCTRVRWALRLQVVFTAIKVLALLIIIVAGFVCIFKGQSKSLRDTIISPDDFTPSDLPVAIYRGLYAYSGWQTIGFLTEEVKNPNRNIPLSLMICLPVVIALYCLVAIVYSSVLSPEQLMSSNKVAIIYSKAVLGKWFWIVPPLIALSTLSTINGMIITGSRMFLVASREQKAPEWWSMIQIRWRTPTPALLTLLSVSLIMIPIHQIATVLGWLYSFLWVSVGGAVAVIPIFRRRAPKLDRPFMVPIAFPFICIIFCVFALAMSLYLDARACGLTLAFAVVGFVIRRILDIFLQKTKWFPRLLDKTTSSIQKLLMVVHQEKKTY